MEGSEHGLGHGASKSFKLMTVIAFYIFSIIFFLLPSLHFICMCRHHRHFCRYHRHITVDASHYIFRRRMKWQKTRNERNVKAEQNCIFFLFWLSHTHTNTYTAHPVGYVVDSSPFKHRQFLLLLFRHIIIKCMCRVYPARLSSIASHQYSARCGTIKRDLLL